MAEAQQMSQLLEHLRLQLEQQVAALHERRQQLRATMEQDVESASQQVQTQREVLDNLRYEAEVLTEKLMKLRASRQDIEAELFQLKDKRIKLLEVINKLEDEEQQLVSEVNRIIHYKRSLLKEVPHFEARAKASASLAVVQDYLLASIHHIQGQPSGSMAASTAAAASAPSWQGTANVRRPSASWISMPPTPAAGSSVSPSPGSAASSLPPTPGVAPDLPSIATAAPGDSASAAASAGAGAGSAGAAAAALPAPASDTGLTVAGTAEAVERLHITPGKCVPAGGQQQQQSPHAQQQSPRKQLQDQQQRDGGPFAAVTMEQLLHLQPQEASPMAQTEGLPTLHEGEPFPTDGQPVLTPVGSTDPTTGRPTQLMPARSSGSYPQSTTPAGGKGGRDATSSGWSTSTLTSRGSVNSGSSATLTSRGSGSLRSAGSLPAGALSSGSFTSPASGLQRRSSDGSPAPDQAVSSTVASAAAAAAAATVTEASSSSTSSAADAGQRAGQRVSTQQPSMFTPTPPPPPPRRNKPGQMQQPQQPQQQSPIAAASGASRPLDQQQQQHAQLPQQPPQQPVRQQPPPPPPALVISPHAGVYLQHELPQSPHRYVLVQQHQPAAEQTVQITIPQLQYQLQQAQLQQAQLQQAQQQQAQQQAQQQQAQQQQQQHQQVMLQEYLLPVSVGLQAAAYDLGGGAGSLDVHSFTSSPMPGLGHHAGMLPLRVAAAPAGVSAASREMWVLPAGALLLQAQPADERQALSAGMLSLQQVQGLAAAAGVESSAAAATAAGGGAGAGGAGGPGLSPAASPLMVLRASPGDASGQSTGLYMQQAADQNVRLLQGQQLQQLGTSPADLDTSATYHEAQ